MGTLLLLASMKRICSFVAVRFLLPFALPSLCLDLDSLDRFEWSEIEDLDFFDFRDLVTDIEERSPDNVEFYLRWSLDRQRESLR